MDGKRCPLTVTNNDQGDGVRGAAGWLVPQGSEKM
jgi:hypothetical protein